MNTSDIQKTLLRIKICMFIIIIGLALSGITAFPIQTELEVFIHHNNNNSGQMSAWLHTIYNAVKNTNQNYPWLSYGTDWLAFAHIMLAILFIGPLRHPLKNKWIIEFGMIACIAIFPLAFIAGSIRGIPIFWQLIDCSFGVFGMIPLYIAWQLICKLEACTYRSL
ncbi:MAG: hypothetical protein ABIN91_10005 [Mucilaginibacter sp.]